jgi:hypothetical protein
MGATHFPMKTLPKVASEMALSVLAYNLMHVINAAAPRRAARMRQCCSDRRSAGGTTTSAIAAIMLKFGLSGCRYRARDRHGHGVPDDFLLYRVVAVTKLVSGL